VWYTFQRNKQSGQVFVTVCSQSLIVNDTTDQTVNDGVAHECQYHVTFDLDLDLEHILDAC